MYKKFKDIKVVSDLENLERAMLNIVLFLITFQNKKYNEKICR